MVYSEQVAVLNKLVYSVCMFVVNKSYLPTCQKTRLGKTPACALVRAAKWLFSLTIIGIILCFITVT